MNSHTSNATKNQSEKDGKRSLRHRLFSREGTASGPTECVARTDIQTTHRLPKYQALATEKGPMAVAARRCGRDYVFMREKKYRPARANSASGDQAATAAGSRFTFPTCSNSALTDQ